MLLSFSVCGEVAAEEHGEALVQAKEEAKIQTGSDSRSTAVAEVDPEFDQRSKMEIQN